MGGAERGGETGGDQTGDHKKKSATVDCFASLLGFWTSRPRERVRGTERVRHEPADLDGILSPIAYSMRTTKRYHKRKSEAIQSLHGFGPKGEAPSLPRSK